MHLYQQFYHIKAFIIIFHICLYAIFDHLLYLFKTTFGFSKLFDSNISYTREQRYQVIQHYIYTKRSKYKNIEYCKKINFYSLSSFICSLVGFFLLKFPLHMHHYDAFYPYFLIFQGIFSYLGDSLYIDQVHWSHRIDPSLAKYNTMVYLAIGCKYQISRTKWILIFLGIL